MDIFLYYEDKSETFNCFRRFHIQAEKHTGSRIGSINIVRRTSQTAEEFKTLRTDNGGEYISNEFKCYLENMEFNTNSLLLTLHSRTESLSLWIEHLWIVLDHSAHSKARQKVLGWSPGNCSLHPQSSLFLFSTERYRSISTLDG